MATPQTTSKTKPAIRPMDSLPPVEFNSPIDMLIGPVGDGESDAESNAHSGKGVDPYTRGKLLAMANAAWASGNSDLASDLEALAGLQPNLPKGEISGEEKKEETVTTGSGAPKTQSRDRAPDEPEPEVQLEVKRAPAPKKPEIKNSDLNEAIWKEYGERAWAAYIDPKGDGTIASALATADAWKADKWNTTPAALGITVQKEKVVEGPAPVAAVTMSTVVDPVRENDAIASMSRLVNPAEFPNLEFSGASPALLVPDNVGKRQGHGFTGHTPPKDDD